MLRKWSKYTKVLRFYEGLIIDIIPTVESNSCEAAEVNFIAGYQEALYKNKT